jgi:transcriptional regulator with XRE-family HTH domain
LSHIHIHFILQMMYYKVKGFAMAVVKKRSPLPVKERPPLPVGRRLKERREQLGITQETLAAQVGMSQNFISRLENDATYSPGADVLLRLARALHCSIDWLVGLYDEGPPPVFPVETRRRRPPSVRVRRYRSPDDAPSLPLRHENDRAVAL